MAEKIVLPRLFLTMEEGLITKWYKSKGDRVSAGEILFSVEAEKASQDIESPVSGILANIYITEGGSIPVGAEVALIVGENESVSDSIDAFGCKTQQDTISINPVKSDLIGVKNIGLETPAVNTQVPHDVAQGFAHDFARTKIMPKARRMAIDMGIDLTDLSRVYPQKSITEKEVLDFQEKKNILDSNIEEKEKYKTDRYEVFGIISQNAKRIKASALRQAIAKKMTESLSKAAQLTNGMEVDLTDLLARVKELKSVGKGISFTGCVIKACALALKTHPDINCKYLEEESEILLENNINIGFAADVDGGLLVPVIKDADRKNIFEISKELATLAQKAKEGRLSVSEMESGTFTVTNVGMYGLAYFTPLLNYPEAAILGVGASKLTPVYLDENRPPVPRHIAMLNLTYDHRVIDGAPAARFMLSIKSNIENPGDLLDAII